jgi:hypothetical protein
LKHFLPLLLLPAILVGCEHDEHPFEVPWSVECSAEGAPTLWVTFDKDFWVDDAGKRREYIGEAQVELDADLYDSWIWRVGVNLQDETAETLELVHVPIPASFTAAYDLKTLDLQPDTYVEDPEGAWAEMSGTCAWGAATGVLSMRMNDDCDACITCSSLGPVLPGLVILIPALLGLRRRTDAVED